MKKIYTVTFHEANNYGAVLQAFALQKFLSKKYDTAILNYNNRAISDCYKPITTGGEKGAKALLAFVKSIINYPKTAKRAASFNAFRKKLVITDVKIKRGQIKEKYLSAYAYITGSDQVWNSELTGGVDDVYSLNFGNNDFRKISYAASCGSVDHFLKNQEYFKKALSGYSAVSVREKSLQNAVNSLKGKRAALVSDPTILLGEEEWGKIAEKKRLIKNKYIFAYSVGNATPLFYKAVNKVAKDTGYDVVFFDKWDKNGQIHATKHSMYSVGPSEFLGLMRDSEIVVTTSFHGVALSSIFNKKMVITPSTYSERIMTIAESLGLTDRIISNENEIPNYAKPIDWGSVNRKINRDRTNSAKWLLDAIENRE